MEESNAAQPGQQDEKQFWTAHKSLKGITYYFNSKTQKSQWYKPTCMMSKEEQLMGTEWQEITTTDGKIFYYNTKLKKSSWNLPEELRLAKAQQAELNKQAGISGDNQNPAEKKEKTEEELKEEAAKAFKELLKEKRITQNHKWDWAQQTLSSDPRYNNVKQISEKKRLFQEYVQEQRQKEKMEEKNKLAKEKMDFYKMLEEAGLKSDAKYHKCVQNFVKDNRFRNVEEKLRENYFQDYLDTLFEQEREEQELLRKQNSDILRQKFVKLELGMDYTWNECCQLMKDDPTWKNLHDLDRIRVFSDYIKELEKKDYEEKRQIRKATERKQRIQFRELLKEKIISGELTQKTKWHNFVHKIKDDERLLNMLGQFGSTPHELFVDQTDQLIQYSEQCKPEIKKYIKQVGIQLSATMTFEEFYLRLQMFNIFNGLEHHMKFYFYHMFLNKAKSKEKENQKKAQKQQKKFTKMMKHITVAGKSLDDDVEKQMDALINSKYQILQSLTREQKKQMFEEYMSSQKKKQKLDDAENCNESSEDEKKTKKGLTQTSKDRVKPVDKKPEKKLKSEKSSSEKEVPCFKPQIQIEPETLQQNPLLAAYAGQLQNSGDNKLNPPPQKAGAQQPPSQRTEKIEVEEPAKPKKSAQVKGEDSEEGEVNEEGEIKESSKRDNPAQLEKNKGNSSESEANHRHASSDRHKHKHKDKTREKEKDKKHKKRKEKEDKKSKKNREDSADRSD